LKAQGFTVVEVLVAILLFAIVVLAVLAPLSGLFSLTKKSSQQVSATNIAQQAIETIRGQWQNASRVQYDLNCIAGPLTTAATNPTVSVRNGNSRGTFQNPAVSLTVGDATTCPAFGTAVPGPQLREVTVTATVNGNTAKLVVEVAR
jgi:prepilin-type N-terminal cleavage/methylation domain-containing protein